MTAHTLPVRVELPCLFAVVIGMGCTGDGTDVRDASTSSESSTEAESSSTSASESETESESGTDSGTETGTETGSETDTTDDGPDEPQCGNGIVELDEVCDDGNTTDWDACSNECTLPACGDGMVQLGEGCDLGPNNGPGQLCNAMCQPNVCGDGDVGPGEGCDDGNRSNDDACPNDCVLVSCGNGIVDPGEECEDGNDNPSDGCTTACLFPICGDGVVWLGHELCDDGNPDETDACSTACEPAACGDGLVQLDEACDDGNGLANDGCNTCVVQRVLQIGVGTHFACALLDTGSVRCWGSPTRGQLGYGNDEPIGDDELPWTAGDVDVGGTVLQIGVGPFHACALLEGGSVRCWGNNYDGELGYGNTEDIGDDEPPSAAGDVDVGGTVVQLGVGRDRTCVILDSGAVRCWGYGYYGLGYANTVSIGDNETPASAGDIDLGGPAEAISSHFHTCALLSGGGLRCWGENLFGSLGYPFLYDIGDDETPASVGDVDLGPGMVVGIETSAARTCVIIDDGALRCWGRSNGTLGYSNHQGDIGDDETPGSVGDLDIDPVIAVGLGESHTCAVLEGGALRCWGYNWYGVLGTGDLDSIDFPEQTIDVEIGDPVASISSDEFTNCVITEAGGVRCWGRGDDGALGYGNTSHIGDDEWPVFAGYVQVFEP